MTAAPTYDRWHWHDESDDDCTCDGCLDAVDEVRDEQATDLPYRTTVRPDVVEAVLAGDLEVRTTYAERCQVVRVLRRRGLSYSQVEAATGISAPWRLTEEGAAKQRAYYEQNRDEIAAKKRAYREQNRDEIAAKQRAYYEQNRDEIAAKQRAYYEQNRDEIAAKKRAYREQNRDEIAAKQRAYYEQKKTRRCADCGARCGGNRCRSCHGRYLGSRKR